MRQVLEGFLVAVGLTLLVGETFLVVVVGFEGSVAVTSGSEAVAEGSGSEDKVLSGSAEAEGVEEGAALEEVAGAGSDTGGAAPEMNAATLGPSWGHDLGWFQISTRTQIR